MANLGRIENLFLPSSAGQLEVLWKHQPHPTNRFVIISHPHPMHGGTMHNKVVFQAAKAFFLGKFEVVRFNFRGVGQSTGSFANGEAEQDDLRVVLREVRRRAPGADIVLCGYSFGAYVSARVSMLESPRAFVLVAPPSKHYSFEFLRNLKAAAVVVFGDYDEFSASGDREQIASWLVRPHMVLTLSANHYFESQLESLQQLLTYAAVPFLQFLISKSL